jgi:WD40 repeat protein
MNSFSCTIPIDTFTDKIGKLTPDPWKETNKRHPKSSWLARFRPDIAALTPTLTSPVATSVYDARCEVWSMPINSPIRLGLSQSDVCLAMNAMGGWKNRSPVLYYYLLDGSEKTTDFPWEHSLQPGLEGIAFHMAFDESRRLIFVGDEGRVKSYAWANPSGKNYKAKPRPTHTLNSDRFSGPMTVLPNGTIIRAGTGNVAVWDINGLETHGEDGNTVVGEEIEIENTMRDDPEEIEQSSGSAATSHVKFVDQPNLKVSMWQPLVQTPSTMLCATNSFGCVMIDLEHEGKTTARYLGHGGDVNNISVSAADPQTFLTACNDGYARLFDIRTPLPVLTFDACGQQEACDAAVLAHPDGIPSKCI